MHMLLALTILSKSSDRLRESRGDVRTWASDHDALYGSEGTEHGGVLTPLAQTLNTKLQLRVPLYKADWEWACPRVEAEGMVNIKAVRTILQESDIVSKTWTFIKKGSSVNIPPCQQECSGVRGPCYCCCTAASLFADVLEVYSVVLTLEDQASLNCLEYEWIRFNHFRDVRKVPTVPGATLKEAFKAIRDPHITHFPWSSSVSSLPAVVPHCAHS